MASGSSGSGSGTPLGITLPDWMKRKTPDRYAFDETPFSPPSPSDEYFLIKYPYKEPEKKSSYETINSLTAAGVRSSSLSSATRRDAGSADALGPATTSPPTASSTTSSTSTLSPADAKEAKVRRNSAVTVLPSGQVSIKTYGDPSAASTLKKSSDPSAYYGDYANHFRKTIADEEMQVAVTSGDLMEEGAYDSDASVGSNPNPGAGVQSVPSANATPPAATGGGSSSSVSGHLTSSILGALGHHLTDLATGGHGIMDYFHQHEEHEAPVPAASSFGGSASGSPLTSQPGTPSDLFPKASSNVERKGVRADKHRRIGLGSFPAPSNPFFAADGSTMSMFSGLYQKDSEMTTSASSPGALVQQSDAHQHQQSVALAQQPGSVVPNLVGAVAANRSSSAYDSQLAVGGHGLSDVEMEAVARVADNARNRRWVPKPSKQREMNLFAPCST